MPHPLYSPEITQLLIEKDAEGLRALCDTLHPATVAEALDDDFEPAEVWEVLGPSDVRTQAAIFEYLPLSRQVEMVEGPARPEAGRLIGKMSHDDRADLLGRVPDRVREGLLRFVDEADRRDIATLGTYADGTVGALMTTDYAWLPPTLTAAEAVDQLRTQAPDRETIYYVYILDEAPRKPGAGVSPRRLLGVLSLRDLILAPRHTLIRDVMESDGLETLRVDDDQQKAADLLARYDFIALPVLDAAGGMVGIVTHDDVIDVIQEEATDDLQKQGGVSPLGAGYLEAPFASVWRKRTQWLSFLFVAEMMTFYAMDFFESALESVKALKYFVPLAIATGGNSGTQAASLITRALALGEVTVKDWLRVLLHEFLMGLAMGAALAVIAFGRAMTVSGDMLTRADGPAATHTQLGKVLALAVLCICLYGTIVGSMLPLGFRRLGIDPGLASSPFVSTFVDVTGIIIFFVIATNLLLR